MEQWNGRTSEWTGNKGYWNIKTKTDIARIEVRIVPELDEAASSVSTI